MMPMWANGVHDLPEKSCISLILGASFVRVAIVRTSPLMVALRRPAAPIDEWRRQL